MARNDDYINIGMGLDIADLKAGLQDAKSQLKLAESEFKKNTSALDKWGESAEGVLEQVLLLNEKIAYQEKQMAYTRAEIEKAAEKYGAASTKVKDLTAKLNDQEAYLNRLKSQMATARGKLDDFATGESLAGKSAKELADSVERLKARLAEQETAAGNLRIELDKVVKQYGEGSVQAKALSDQIAVQDEKLRDIRTVLSSYEAALDEVGDDAEDAARSLDKMNDEMDESEGASQGLVSGGLSKLKDKLVDLAKNGVMMVVDALKQFVKQTIQAGMDFTSTMSEVQALSGATGDELKMMEETAREFGRSTTFSATEAAEALKYMALAGWDAGQSTSALGGILDLAAASGMELGEASDIVTDYLTAFGLDASDASRMADLLAYAQANANTSVKQLAEGYKNSAATLAANGQSLETVTALLATLSNAGLKGGEAGTALAAVMRDVTARMEGGAIKIGSASVRVADAEGNFRSLTDILRDVGTAVDGLGSADRADALATTFSSYSLKGINTLLQQGADSVDAFTESLKGSGGEAKRMSAIMYDNLGGDMKSLDSAIEDLQLRLFDLLEGPLRGIVQFLTDAIPVIIGWGEDLYDFFVGIYDATKPIWDALGEFFGWLGESIGIIGDAFGKAAEAVSGILGEASDELEAFGKAAVGKVEEPWETVPGFFGDVWGGVHKQFDESSGTFKTIGSSMASGLMDPDTWTRVADGFKDVVGGIQGAFEGVSAWFGDLSGEMRTMLEAGWDKVGEFFGGVWEAIKKPFEPVVEWFGSLFGGPGGDGEGGAVGAVKRPFEVIGDFFSGVWDAIKRPFEPVTEFFSKLFGDVRSAIERPFDRASEWFEGAFGEAWEAAKRPFEGVGRFFSGVWDSVAGAFHGADGWFGRAFGGMWDAACKAFEGVGAFFSGVWERVKAAFMSAPEWFGGLFGGENGVWERVKAPFAKAGAWASGVWQSIAKAFDGSVKWAEATFGSVWKALAGAFSGAGAWASGVWTDVTKAFTGASSWFGRTFSDAWDAMKRPFDGVVSFFSRLFGGDSGKGGVVQAIEKPFERIGDFFGGVWDDIKKPFAPVVGFFSGLFGGRDGAVNAIEKPFDGIKKFFEGVYDSIVAPFKGVVDFFKGIFGGKTDGKGDNADTAGAAGAIKKPFAGIGGFFSSLWSNIVAGMLSLPNDFGTLFGRAYTAIKNVFSGIAGWFSEYVVKPIKGAVDEAVKIGGELGKGLIEGATNKRDIVAGSTTIGELFADALCDAFGIHSPSKVMRDRVGLMIGAGIVEGMKDSELMGVQEAARWSKRLSDGLVVTPDVTAGAYAQGPGQTVNNVTYNQTINSPEPLSAGEIYRDTRSLIGRRTWA